MLRRSVTQAARVGLVSTMLAAVACTNAPAPTPMVIVVTATPVPATAAPPTQAPAPSPTALPPTPVPPTATAVPATPTAAPRKNEVSALYFSQGPQGFSGGTSKVTVAIDKGANPDLRVGFFEREVGGSGPQWRAAGWMAVVMANFLLGTDPSAYTYSFDVGGRVDGPSAGALMTVAALASMLGQTVRADATMTGTINPDGTLGPVGGIPQKLDGAIKDGKKLVVIPAGQRQSLDMATKQRVDVIELGRSKGVEVKEASDIYEAYQLMVGKDLPKPAGMRDARPEMPQAGFERAKSKAKEWTARYQQMRSQYRALPANAKVDFSEDMFDDADKAAARAEELYAQGVSSAAYGRAVAAAQNATIGFHTAKMIDAYQVGGMNGAKAYLQSIRTVRGKIDALADRLQTQNAQSTSDVVAIAEAYGYLGQALGVEQMGNAALNRQIDTSKPDVVVGTLAEATLWFAVADLFVDLARDSIDLGVGTSPGGSPPVAARVRALSELFRQAAEANSNYFDQVVLNEVAQSNGVHLDAVRARFAGKDLNYALAVSALQAGAYLKNRASTNATAGTYATLGTAMSSYGLSSVLVAKYYSLDAVVDEDLNVTSVNDRGMINALDFAEKRSRELVALASASGGLGVQPVLAYENAKLAREGSLDEKFDALKGFWDASMQSQISAALSGKASVVP